MSPVVQGTSANKVRRDADLGSIKHEFKQGQDFQRQDGIAELEYPQTRVGVMAG